VTDGTKEGRPFDPGDESWRKFGVFAPRKEEGGPENLRPPDRETLIFDDDITVPLVEESARRRTATTLLRSGEPVIGEADHFLSIFYAVPVINGKTLSAAAVTYHTTGTLEFTQEPGPWIAVCLGRFEPRDRVSAEYIAPVDRE